MGNSASAAIKNDGTLWMWGRGVNGVLGDGSGNDRSSPATTGLAGTNWKQVSMSGFFFAAAIKSDGTLWNWGNNATGQLGRNNTTLQSVPGTTAGGGTNWKQVSCGYKSLAAIKTDGTLWVCGDNTNGQLGDNSTTNRSSFITTSGGGTNWREVGMARTMCGAVKTDGTLWTWGSGLLGQLGDGTTTDRSSPGTTAGGGTNWRTVPTYGSDIRLVYTAIKTDGTLWTWGFDSTGALGSSTITNRSSPGTTDLGINNWKQISAAGNNDRTLIGIMDHTI
jgi:alpha-tubulin suppressor-like RCC1 family protein